MKRRVLLYPGEDGYTVAEVPSLPGCVSQGTTREEALANIREAISLHEEALRERGESIPDDRVELVEVASVVTNQRGQAHIPAHELTIS